MVLPTLQKTWQFDVNNSQSTGTTTGNAQEALFTIKDAFVSFASSPWTVVSSSDSTATASSDLWSVQGDLIWDTAGNVHSWIVLKQTGMADNFQICIDLNSTDTDSLAMIVSHTAGFTGGTTTARPTATDEAFLEITVSVSTNSWGRGSSPTTTNTPIHIMMSDDGEATRVIFNKADAVTGYWDFQKVRNPSTNWTTPYGLIYSCQTASAACGYLQLRDADVASRFEVRLIVPKPSEQLVSCRYCSEGYKSDSYGTNIAVANEITAEWELMPIGVFCDKAPNRGRHGDMYDVWFTSTGLSTGDSMPDDSSHQFAVFDDVVFPWNGSLPVTT